MPDEAQLRLLAFAFPVEPGIGIGSRSMAIVRAFLAMEVCFGIAPAALRRRLARAVLWLDALHRGPGFDQRAIDREVIARQKLIHLGLRSTAARNLAAMSPSSTRSRFFETPEWPQAASSTPIPANKRNSRSYSSRSIRSRSERIE